MNCENCGKETSNPKYCGKSCAASANNTRAPKRKPTRVCHLCNDKVKSHRHTKCATHWQEYLDNKSEAWKTKTVGDLRSKDSLKNLPRSSLNVHVRTYASTWLTHLKKDGCKVCGYTTHVELAHIKPVSSFPDSALLGDINAESNVVPLCRNHHWEFDNGIIDLST